MLPVFSKKCQDEKRNLARGAEPVVVVVVVPIVVLIPEPQTRKLMATL